MGAPTRSPIQKTQFEFQTNLNLNFLLSIPSFITLKFLAMEDSLSFMAQNARQATTLLALPHSLAAASDVDAHKEMAPNGGEVAAEEEQSAPDMFVDAPMAALSLTMKPAFVPKISSATRALHLPALPRELKFPANAERKALGKVPVSEKKSAVLKSGTSSLSQAMAVSASPVRAVSVPTNMTLFPDLVRVPKGNGFGYDS